MRLIVALGAVVLLCACSTAKPAETASAAKPVAAAAAPAAAQPAAQQTAQASAPKVECRRVKVLGSIKYKDECQTKSDSAAATKAGKESRDAAARSIQGASGLGN
jgi:hypothetical protein